MRVIPFTTTRVQVRLAPPRRSGPAPTRLTHSLHTQPALRRVSQWCPLLARGQRAFHLMAATTRISASDSSDSPRLPAAVAGRLQSLAPLQCIPPGESTSGGLVVVLPAVPCSCPATPRGPRGFHVPTSERLENSSPMTTVTFSPAWTSKLCWLGVRRNAGSIRWVDHLWEELLAAPRRERGGWCPLGQLPGMQQDNHQVEAWHHSYEIPPTTPRPERILGDTGDGLPPPETGVVAAVVPRASRARDPSHPGRIEQLLPIPRPVVQHQES